jgi:hypothetical protein
VGNCRCTELGKKSEGSSIGMPKHWTVLADGNRSSVATISTCLLFMCLASIMVGSVTLQKLPLPTCLEVGPQCTHTHTQLSAHLSFTSSSICGLTKQIRCTFLQVSVFNITQQYHNCSIARRHNYSSRFTTDSNLKQVISLASLHVNLPHSQKSICVHTHGCAW